MNLCSRWGFQMADCLYYWKKYWDNRDNTDFIHYTKHKTVFNQISRGDNLWVVVSANPKNLNGKWRLLQRVRIDRIEPSKRKPGEYRVIGNKRKSESYGLDSQPDFVAVLWLLDFESGNRITSKGKGVGAFLNPDGFRKLTDSDKILLRKYAKVLKLY